MILDFFFLQVFDAAKKDHGRGKRIGVYNNNKKN